MDEVCCIGCFYHLATDAMVQSTAGAAAHSGRDPTIDGLRPMVRPLLERLEPLAELTGREHADLPEGLYPVLYATGGSAT